MAITINGTGTITVTDGSGTTTINSTTVKTQNVKHPSATPNNIALSSNVVVHNNFLALSE